MERALALRCGTLYRDRAPPSRQRVKHRACTCPDYETPAVKCKHLFSVEYVIERERNLDGTGQKPR